MSIFSRLFGKADSGKDNGTSPFVQEQGETSLKARHSRTSAVSLSPQEQVNYFREILTSEFPQYTLRENVAVAELVGDANDTFKLYKRRPYQAYKAEWGEPYTFVLYNGENLAGIVMLGGKGSHCDNVKFLISRVYAKKLGIPYIGFYTNMANEIGYVVKRLADNLNK